MRRRSNASFVAACRIKHSRDQQNGDGISTRTTSRTVTFQRPFVLAGFQKLQAAGSYTVDTAEEVTTTAFPAQKRTSMVIRRAGAIEHVPVDPHELHEALMRDGAQADLAHPASRSTARARRHTARNGRLPRHKKS